jgi:thioredoxin-related protein
MKKISSKVELTANILIIVVALALGAVLVQRYFFAPSTAAATQPPRVQPTVGTKINLSDENWSAQPKTLILALQTTCHFCNESAPFYKRLIQEAKSKKIKLVAVFPTKVEESTAHLNELGLSGMEVKQSPLGTLQTSGTPTLILTNDKGEITNFWVGKLQPDKEDEVITTLNS